MLLVLFIILSRGRSRKSAEPVVAALESMPTPQQIEQMPAVVTAAQAAKPNKPNMPTAQPIVEDPQKVYIREQIQSLGKSNPATVAQLIQTWMDEDRRN
jgi:flagellar biosynthesis/type III secretory pathway M-ring protein FliF/YscJ